MKPVVVQHSFGDPGSGGPIGALQRLLDSPVARRYEFVRMHQSHAAGGIDVGLVRSWVAMLRDVRPDLVHVRGLGNEGLHGVLAARLARCPKVLVSLHGSVRDLTHAQRGLRREVLIRVAEPATLRMATDIVAVCRAMEERAFLNRVRAKVVGHVPNGVDVTDSAAPGRRAQTRAQLGLSDRDVAVSVVGRLSLEKGHLHLAGALRVLESSTREAIVLVLVGDGPDSHTIARAYHSVPGLRLLALGRRHDVADILRASDVFAFPTLHENLSNALLEAMAAGLPVVASAVGGNIEVLERGGGFLVPAGDPEPLSAAIDRLVSDPGLRARFGREAVETVRGSYSLDHMVAGWDRLYQSILSRGEHR